MSGSTGIDFMTASFMLINDVTDCLISSDAILFAADTSNYSSHTNIASLYEVINLELLLDWFKANKLTLNISKTNYMLFTNKNETHNFQIKMNNCSINKTSSVIFLGIHVDDKLSYTVHIYM